MKVEFAVSGGHVFTNINFAREEAMMIADKTGKEVDVNHHINGIKGLSIFTAKPKKDVDVE